MRTNKSKLRRVLCSILMLLMIFSSYVMAKYVSSVNGIGSASVAKWSVNWIGTGSNVLNLVSGNSDGSYTFNVTSASEVAASYSITVSNAPSGIEIKLDNESFQTVGSSGEITFNNVGSFSANDTNNIHEHTLTFNSPLAASLSGTNSIEVDVRFTQND